MKDMVRRWCVYMALIIPLALGALVLGRHHTPAWFPGRLTYTPCLILIGVLAVAILYKLTDPYDSPLWRHVSCERGEAFMRLLPDHDRVLESLAHPAVAIVFTISLLFCLFRKSCG